MVYYAIACFLAYLFESGHSGIYRSQRVAAPKGRKGVRASEEDSPIASVINPYNSKIWANDGRIEKSPKAMRWLTRSVLGIGLASLFSDASHETVTSVLPALSCVDGRGRRGSWGPSRASPDGLSSAAKLYGGW